MGDRIGKLPKKSFYNYERSRTNPALLQYTFSQRGSGILPVGKRMVRPWQGMGNHVEGVMGK